MFREVVCSRPEFAGYIINGIIRKDFIYRENERIVSLEIHMESVVHKRVIFKNEIMKWNFEYKCNIG